MSIRNWRSCIHHIHCEVTKTLHLLPPSVVSHCFFCLWMSTAGEGRTVKITDFGPNPLPWILFSFSLLLWSWYLSVMKWMSDMHYRVSTREARKPGKTLTGFSRKDFIISRYEILCFFYTIFQKIFLKTYLLTDEHEIWEGQLKRNSLILPTPSWFFLNFYSKFFIFIYKS